MSTSAQRDLIRSLMRELEWDRERVTLQHTRAPHCPRGLVGISMEGWISGLTRAQASQVIAWMQKELS